MSYSSQVSVGACCVRRSAGFSRHRHLELPLAQYVEFARLPSSPPFLTSITTDRCPVSLSTLACEEIYDIAPALGLEFLCFRIRARSFDG